jgi:hypothetical protein
MQPIAAIRATWFDLIGTVTWPGLGWQAPLLTLLVALLARWALRGNLAPLGTGLALAAGWLALGGSLRPALLWAPHGASEELLLPTVAAILLALLLPMRAGWSWPVLLLGALCGWWLLGAHGLATILASQVVPIAFLTVVIGGIAQFMPAVAPWQALVAALALLLALPAAGVGGNWPALAAIIAAACAAWVPAGGQGAALLPAGAALGAVAALAALANGRLPHGGLGAADIACAAPLVTLWLPGPLRRLGPRAGAPIAALLMAFAAFLARRLAGF